MFSRHTTTAMAASLLLGTLTMMASAQNETLSNEIAQAIFNKFPKSKINHVQLLEDSEVEIFAVEVIHDGAEKIVMTTREGQIIAIRQHIELEKLPQPIQDSMKAQLEKKQRIEEVSRLETLKQFKPVPLKKDLIQYELELKRNGLVTEIIVDAEGKLLKSGEWHFSNDDDEREEHEHKEEHKEKAENEDNGDDNNRDEENRDKEPKKQLLKLKSLSPKAAARLKSDFNNAKLHEVSRERFFDQEILEVELTINNTRQEIEMTQDGEILVIESYISKEQLPEAVSNLISKKYGDVQFMEIEKQIVKMKMELKSLTKPIISFTASIQRPAAEYNAIFDNSGKILKKSNWRVLEEDEDDEDKDKDDDDEDEDEDDDDEDDDDDDRDNDDDDHDDEEED